MTSVDSERNPNAVDRRDSGAVGTVDSIEVGLGAAVEILGTDTSGFVETESVGGRSFVETKIRRACSETTVVFVGSVFDTRIGGACGETAEEVTGNEVTLNDDAVGSAGTKVTPTTTEVAAAAVLVNEGGVAAETIGSDKIGVDATIGVADAVWLMINGCPAATKFSIV
jgi:hypothetical protein